MLGPAPGQAGNRRTVRAIDLERDQFVAPRSYAPGRIHVRDHAILKPEGRISRIVCIGIVDLSVLVYSLRNVSGAETGHCLHLAEQIVEDITPVAEHIEDDAAAFRFLIVPAWPLRRLAPIALEHPVAEFSANREHPPKEAGITQHPDLTQAGQK